MQDVNFTSKVNVPLSPIIKTYVVADSKETKDDKLKALVNEFKVAQGNEDDKGLLAVLKKMRSKGAVSLLPLLLDTLLETKSESVKQAILGMLNDLKQSAAIPVLIEAIQNPTYEAIRRELIAVFWESSLDASNELPVLAQVAIESEFMTTFECLTVVEHLDGPFQEEIVLDAMVILQAYLGKNIEEEKRELLLTMYSIMKEIDSKLQ